MSEKQKVGLSTIALREGYKNEGSTNACAVPLYLTSAYNFDSSEHAARLFDLKEFGNIYTRLMNPTNDVLEKRLAALHGGTAALTVSSGQAAVTYAVLNITSAGQNIVASKCLYGGTINLFKYTLSRMGIEVRFVDFKDLNTIQNAIDENTRLVFTETIGNPVNNVDDYEKIAEVAHKNGLPLVVDNTVAPPCVYNPFDFGADIVVYSLTKYIAGHGTVLGGALIEKGDFPWNNGHFAEMVDPDPSYHGVSYWGAFGNHEGAVAPGMAFILRARVQLLRDLGACLSPFNAHQIMMGLETLQVRLKAHTENALHIAEWLEQHPCVNWVIYPGLPSHPDHELAQKYFKKGFGALVGFGVKGGRSAGSKFIDAVQMCSHVANLGDAKTLVIHPASTTHQQLSAEQLAASGVTEDFIRLSVGIEDIEDIIADLDQALAASQA